MKKFRLSAVGFGVTIACALLMAAGVNGIFNHVTSQTGYQVAGSAGSSGQALCSDGTNYNTPCTVVGSAFYQTVQEAGTPLTQQPVLNFDGTVVASNGSGKTNVGLPNVGTAGTYIPASLTTDSQGRVSSVTGLTFTGTSGYQQLPSGLIVEWAEGSTCTGDCTETVSFPLTFPHACFTVQTTNDNSVSSTNIVKTWGVNSPCTTTGVLVELQRRGDEGSFSAAPIVFAVGW